MRRIDWAMFKSWCKYTGCNMEFKRGEQKRHRRDLGDHGERGFGLVGAITSKCQTSIHQLVLKRNIQAPSALPHLHIAWIWQIEPGNGWWGGWACVLIIALACASGDSQTITAISNVRLTKVVHPTQRNEQSDPSQGGSLWPFEHQSGQAPKRRTDQAAAARFWSAWCGISGVASTEIHHELLARRQ